jgi:hypothetical protein
MARRRTRHLPETLSNQEVRGERGSHIAGDFAERLRQLKRAPALFLPRAQQAAQGHQRSQMVRIVVGYQQNLAQDGRPITPRDFCE